MSEEYTSLRITKRFLRKLQYTQILLRKLREQQKVSLEQTMDYAIENLLINNKDIANLNEAIIYNVDKGRLREKYGG